MPRRVPYSMCLNYVWHAFGRLESILQQNTDGECLEEYHSVLQPRCSCSSVKHRVPTKSIPSTVCVWYRATASLSKSTVLRRLQHRDSSLARNVPRFDASRTRLGQLLLTFQYMPQLC